MITRPARWQTKAPHEVCCSTRIPVPLSHHSFLQRQEPVPGEFPGRIHLDQPSPLFISCLDRDDAPPFSFPELISHKECSKSFCRGQIPHKSVNLLFNIANINNKLTDLSGN